MANGDTTIFSEFGQGEDPKKNQKQTQQQVQPTPAEQQEDLITRNEIVELRRQARMAEAPQKGLQGLANVIKANRAQKRLKALAPDIHQVFQKEESLEDRSTVLDLLEKSADIDKDNMIIDEKAKAQKKAHGLDALGRIRARRAGGQPQDPNDFFKAGATPKVGGGYVTNEDLLRANGINVDRLKKRSLMFQKIAQDPSSPHSNDELFDAVEMEQKTLNKIREFASKVSGGSRNQMRQMGNTAALIGRGISTQVADLRQMVTEDKMTQAEASKFFKDNIIWQWDLTKAFLDKMKVPHQMDRASFIKSFVEEDDPFLAGQITAMSSWVEIAAKTAQQPRDNATAKKTPTSVPLAGSSVEKPSDSQRRKKAKNKQRGKAKTGARGKSNAELFGSLGK